MEMLRAVHAAVINIRREANQAMRQANLTLEIPTNFRHWLNKARSSAVHKENISPALNFFDEFLFFSFPFFFTFPQFFFLHFPFALKNLTRVAHNLEQFP